MTAPAMVWCPFPDQASAAAAAKTLLDESLIACANILPGMLSLFEWQGERGEAGEVGMLVKTNSALLSRAIARLEELHPYEQPTVLGWHCDTASGPTAAWLGSLGA